MNKVDPNGWFKSSYSNGNGDCVEVADLGGAVALRDSKQQAGPVLVSTVEVWQAFITSVGNDEFGRA
ncbi:DUF397 domain-containing protein [Streptomyces litchfieldiae]|uniref:DUF397 domain-containing protein n=1 Tax=Streptomyces litchfieldiae TaxID=3075543 RepID=A0ABU2MLR7_9ACTN|nr:DUF397 domain-containing protein [Streptomyces sp. DSM 44938]MDT0342435.1 DUF397 domain-containing protein [Streptomyces sp. DSM 44938]